MLYCGLRIKDGDVCSDREYQRPPVGTESRDAPGHAVQPIHSTIYNGHTKQHIYSKMFSGHTL